MTTTARDRIEVRLTAADFSCEHVEIHKLTGKESISRLFSFDLEIVCKEPGGLDPAAITGATASIVFERVGNRSVTGDLDREVLRTVHGMIAEVDDLLTTESDAWAYRLRLVPRAFRLSLIETQDIFQDLTVPQIIALKLELVGLGAEDVEFLLMRDYPAREFIVQYRESDLAFVSRLAEHVGMSFFFEHDGGKDKIVFCDDNARFRPIPPDGEALFRPRGDPTDVYAFASRTKMMPAAYLQQDYNYRTPQVDLTAAAEVPTAAAGGVVEYGAHHKTPEEGKALAELRAEQRVVESRYHLGESDVCRLAAGTRFTLRGHPRMTEDPLVVVEVEHHAEQVVLGQGGGGDERDYRNAFRAIDARSPYRPPRITPRPRIHGVLTALVEPRTDGAIGDMAEIDEHGRYTVRFFFDTRGPSPNRRSSRPIRMIQAHAGPHYGEHFPLKAGVEVLIAFVDGDPDRPLIVGAVPNPITPSPVRRHNALMHRIKTAAGILIEMKDGFSGS